MLIQIAFGALLTINDGTLPCFLSEIFPTRVRYSGFAFKKGDPMAPLFKEALGALMEDGTYMKVLEDWHMTEMALEAPLLNGE